jgi:hypothetical protein
MLTEKQRQYQREYYRKNRERRLAESVAYQSANRDRRAEYMRRYFAINKDKWERTEEENRRRNELRRARYAESESVRIESRRKTREWQLANPEKRKRQRLRTYGITLEQFNAIMARQGGRCAICGYSDRSNAKVFPFVDHCHGSGSVRGILCANCNNGLGHFHDSIEKLTAAIAYLKTSTG